MPKRYFRQLPNFEYVSRDIDKKNISQFTSVKNLFKRGKLREDIFGNVVFFEKYSIQENERPEHVAYKFYEDETLDWVILLSNNILNVQSEWPLSQIVFDSVMLEKYGSYENLYSGVHHYETIDYRDSRGIKIISGGIKISGSWKTNGNYLEVINSSIEDIYSGDKTTVSSEITVSLKTGIPKLEVGKEIIVTNVSASYYRGYYIISEILEVDENQNVKKFKYQTTETPSNIAPSLSGNEEVLFTIHRDRDNDFEDIKSSYYYEYWDDGINYPVEVPIRQFVRAVSNYEYEMNIQNEKGNIFILKPEYLNIIFNDMDLMMRYKKGGSQYLTPTLKRGDNIRLYE